jgi:hypothetical protein
LISANRLDNLGTQRDFKLDYRTGRPVISSPAAFDRLFACRASAVVLVSDRHWRRSTHVNDAMADRISRRATAVVPGVPGFHLYRWQHSPTASCPPLGRPPGKPGT